mmetsp:Transcript_13820/g.28488  ORF Transcript_13820/g.28488 Transcript_13820/m.28488 type:complete len:304 (-) Transcript_13820:362-1273(-)
MGRQVELAHAVCPHVLVVVEVLRLQSVCHILDLRRCRCHPRGVLVQRRQLHVADEIHGRAREGSEHAGAVDEVLLLVCRVAEQPELQHQEPSERGRQQQHKAHLEPPVQRRQRLALHAEDALGVFVEHTHRPNARRLRLRGGPDRPFLQVVHVGLLLALGVLLLLPALQHGRLSPHLLRHLCVVEHGVAEGGVGAEELHAARVLFEELCVLMLGPVQRFVELRQPHHRVRDVLDMILLPRPAGCILPELSHLSHAVQVRLPRRLHPRVELHEVDGVEDSVADADGGLVLRSLARDGVEHIGVV